MSNYHKLREHLASLEHEQWMYWSKKVADKLWDVLRDMEDMDVCAVNQRIDGILESWEKNWKPYKKLSEDVKESDRVWADKVLGSVPIGCPVWQCGGLMMVKERRYPKGKNEDDFPEGMVGDMQTPDLVCQNCGAVYEFKKFKCKKRRIKR